MASEKAAASAQPQLEPNLAPRFRGQPRRTVTSLQRHGDTLQGMPA